MNTIHRNTAASLRVSAAIALLALSALATAHDPLSDDPAHVHPPEGYGLHADNTGKGMADIANIRAQVIAFRETGDDRYLDKAWAELEPSLDTANAETLVAAAFVAQSRHHFELALDFIDGALTQNSSNDEAWLLRASIELVLGDTRAASSACGQLRNSPPLILLTCKARVELSGTEQAVALRRLAAVLSISEAQQLPADTLAWSYGVAGDLAVAAEQDDAALTLYERSLDYAERTQVRAAMVDVLLKSDAHSDEDILDALDEGADALPLLVRRLIVMKRMDRLHNVATTVAKVESEFSNWIRSEDWLHAREMARFFLDVAEQPELARKLALINIDLQREPEDLRLELRTRIVTSETTASL